jgi:hypothetical protein
VKERELEKYFARRVRELGGLTYKWSSLSSRGVPDRIVFWSRGLLDFIELKTETGDLSPVQRVTLKRIEERGQTVFVLYGKDHVDFYLNARAP